LGPRRSGSKSRVDFVGKGAGDLYWGLPYTDEGGGPAGVVEEPRGNGKGAPAGVVDAAKLLISCLFSLASGVDGGTWNMFLPHTFLSSCLEESRPSE